MQTTAQGFLHIRAHPFPGVPGFPWDLPPGSRRGSLTLYGGVVADRVPKRKLIVVTQSAMMVLAFILAFLTFLHLVQPWARVDSRLSPRHRELVRCTCAAVLRQRDGGSRRSDKRDRNELDDVSVGHCRGTAIAGVHIRIVRARLVLHGERISFIAVIAALLAMKFPPREVRQCPGPRSRSSGRGYSICGPHSHNPGA